MGHRAKELEHARKARARLRMVQHDEQVTRNVSRTCRFFGISRTQFFIGRKRSHQVYVSPPTIARILKQHRMPRVSLKRYRPGPRRRRELRIPGQSVQGDVKHLKRASGRLYQFTAVNRATRYRVLQIYDHNSVKSATAFVDEVRRRLPAAIQRIRTDHGSEFGTDLTRHLHDLGTTHPPIPRGSPESNGKVERSHRTDEGEFDRRVIFRSPQDLAQKLQAWEHEYNHRRPHLALGGKPLAERLCELRISTSKPPLASRWIMCATNGGLLLSKDTTNVICSTHFLWQIFRPGAGILPRLVGLRILPGLKRISTVQGMVLKQSEHLRDIADMPDILAYRHRTRQPIGGCG